MSVSLSDRVKAAPDVLFPTVGVSGALSFLSPHRVLGLIAIGARVWTILEPGATIQAAYDALLQDYEVDPSKLRLDLDLFIGQLVEHELVEDAEHAPDREPR